MKTFWNGEHELSVRSTELFERLVPFIGTSLTLQGELLRASTKISYDWYNNGWGCNNWSGAVLFIRQQFKLLPNQPAHDALAALQRNLDTVHQYSHGEPCSMLNADSTLVSLHSIIVQALIDNPEPILNTLDMHSLEEDSYQECYDEEYDDEEV